MNKEREAWLQNQTITAVLFFVLFIYVFFQAIPSGGSAHWRAVSLLPVSPNSSSNQSRLKVYLYPLPRKFTYGVVERYWTARGHADVADLKYPSHQHSAEWHLLLDLTRDERDRFGSPAVRVSNPEEADLFYVPFFSSLSWVASKTRSLNGSVRPTKPLDAEAQEELVAWLEEQEQWRRSKGRDHVVVCQNPNALRRVKDRVKNAVWLVSDSRRVRPHHASLAKDVVVPYSHRVSTYRGGIGVENRKTLLFFMGNRFRPGVGEVRELLFQALENEEDVIMKYGAPSQRTQPLASQGMHSSKFCLHPAGSTPASCRLFDAIHNLCVPVIVSDSIELPFEDVIDYRKIAIFVQSTYAVKQGFLVTMLRNVTTERILEYQQELKLVRRYFDYRDRNGPVNEIWRQVSLKLPLIKLMKNRDSRLAMMRVVEPDCSCICSNHTGVLTTL